MTRSGYTGLFLAAGIAFAAAADAQTTRGSTRGAAGAKTTTAIGCLEPAAQANSFVLSVLEETRAASVGSRLLLTGADRSDAQDHVGQKVEVLGTLMPQRQTDSTADRRMAVRHIRPVAPNCGASAARATQPGVRSPVTAASTPATATAPTTAIAASAGVTAPAPPVAVTGAPSGVTSSMGVTGSLAQTGVSGDAVLTGGGTSSAMAAATPTAITTAAVPTAPRTVSSPGPSSPAPMSTTSMATTAAPAAVTTTAPAAAMTTAAPAAAMTTAAPTVAPTTMTTATATAVDPAATAVTGPAPTAVTNPAPGSVTGDPAFSQGAVATVTTTGTLDQMGVSGSALLSGLVNVNVQQALVAVQAQASVTVQDVIVNVSDVANDLQVQALVQALNTNPQASMNANDLTSALQSGGLIDPSQFVVGVTGTEIYSNRDLTNALQQRGIISPSETIMTTIPGRIYVAQP